MPKVINTDTSIPFKQLDVAHDNVLEETMRSKKQEAWYSDQKCVSIHKDVHDKINRVRDEYVKRYHRNIALGYIVEMLLSNDEVITNIYNEVR